MDEFIGAGAILEAGEKATVTPAALHLAMEHGAEPIAATALDLDGAASTGPRRLVFALAGWDVGRFEREVMAPLKARGSASLADVLAAVAQAAASEAVDLFAPWTPDDATVRELRQSGVTVRLHHPSAVARGALTAGQRHWRWSFDYAPAARLRMTS